MTAAHHIEGLRRGGRVDQRRQVRGFGRSQRSEFDPESFSGLVGKTLPQPGHALDHWLVVQRTGTSQQKEGSSQLAQLDARSDVSPHPFGPTLLAWIDDEEVAKPGMEHVEGLALDVGQPVEVPKDRRHRYPGPHGNVVDRGWDLALLDELEGGVDHGLTISFTPGVPAIGSRIRCHDCNLEQVLSNCEYNSQFFVDRDRQPDRCLSQ